MPSAITPIRMLARTGASALRIGAAALEQFSDGPARREPQRQPERGARRPQPKDLDDVTLARKVETTLFRTDKAARAHVDVNVVGGVVYLRGQVKRPADVKRLAAKAKAIPEVRSVENLLHLAKTPAPTRTDTPARQRKEAGRRSKPRTPAVHKAKRVNAEVPAPGGEPAPKEIARTRRGRQPAPLGSSKS